MNFVIFFLFLFVGLSAAVGVIAFLCAHAELCADVKSIRRALAIGDDE